MKVTRVYKHIRQISPKLTFHMRIEYQWTLGKLNEKNMFCCVICITLEICYLFASYLPLIKNKNISSILPSI